jgi:hypothetical protein
MKRPLIKRLNWIQTPPIPARVLAPTDRGAHRKAWNKFGPRYWVWAAAAGSFGIIAGLSLPDSDPSPIQLWAICAGLLAFGIWFAVVNKPNQRGKGWSADILFGFFVSTVLTKYGMLLVMALRSIR